MLTDPGGVAGIEVGDEGRYLLGQQGLAEVVALELAAPDLCQHLQLSLCFDTFHRDAFAQPAAQIGHGVDDGRTPLEQAEGTRGEQVQDLTDRRAAEAEYDTWFNQERRARIWWVVELVFGG